MKKIFKHFTIENILIVGLILNIFIWGLSVISHLNDNNNDNTKIENKNVKIEYIENSKGDYNVIIKAKNNTNFQVSETIEKGENKKATILNGLSVENYRYNWKADLEPLGIKYQWETNKGE